MGTIGTLSVILASQLWFHVVVDSPDEKVEVNIPAEWVTVSILESEADIELSQAEWDEMLAELEAELADGDTHHIVRVREDDETVDVYFEKRADSSKKRKKRARALVVNVREADGSRVFVQLPLWMVRPIARAAIKGETTDEEWELIKTVLDQTRHVEPFELVHVESEGETVRVRFK